MTDKHDFKAVLEDMSERMPYGKNTDETLAGHFATDNYEAIQAALKLIQTYEQRTRRYDHADGALYLELKQEQGTLLRVREVLNQCDEAMEYMSEYDIPIALPDNVKQALAELGALIESVSNQKRLANDIKYVEMYQGGQSPTTHAAKLLHDAVKGGE